MSVACTCVSVCSARPASSRPRAGLPPVTPSRRTPHEADWPTAANPAAPQLREIQRRSVTGTTEWSREIQGIHGIDSDVRNGFDGIKITYKIDADASEQDIKALVAQSQKRSAVYDIVTNPTNITVEVN